MASFTFHNALRTALLSLLLGGHAHAQSAADDRIVEVVVDAKKSSCRIVRSWQSKEGETIFQVENLANREMLTLVPDDAEGAVRIIHWGRGVKSPPPGTPTPPENETPAADAKAHAPSADDRIIEVMVGARKSSCRIVRSWHSTEGETIHQVENLATREMLTLVPDDAEGAVRIIHWGPGVKTPPPGTPTPPESDAPAPVDSEQTQTQAGKTPTTATPIKAPRASAAIEKTGPLPTPTPDVPPLPPVVTGYVDQESETVERTPAPVAPPVRTPQRVERHESVRAPQRIERDEPVHSPAKMDFAPVPTQREVVVEQPQPTASLFVPFVPVRPTPVVVTQPVIPEVTIITPGRAPQPETLYLRPVMRGSGFVPLISQTSLSAPRLPGEFVPLLTTRTSTKP